MAYIIEATHTAFPLVGYVNLRGMVAARPITAAHFADMQIARAVASMLQAHMPEYVLCAVEYNN